MQVLVALHSAQGQILSRDDLIDACWGGRAVTDDAINRVISRLRALSRTFGGFSVETITKVGYRLVEDGVDPRPGQEAASFGRRPLLFGGAALAVAAAAGGSWYAWNRQAGADRPASIAVLPFANLSGDPARQYFADGMAEELRNALARVERLKVIGRTSSESVRNVEGREAATQLGVRHILLGSVRQSPTTIRVSAQLIDGKSGAELWSETYDRPAGDILAIQSSIAESVAQALIFRLGAAERAALTAGGTTNAGAYDLMLKALALDASFDSEEAQRRAVSYMDAAIALDPRYADAHAMRSLRLSQIANYFMPTIAAGQTMNAEAIRAARQGVALAPNSHASRSALGWALQYQLNFREADAQLQQAYRLGRGDARTVRIYATFLWKTGKVDAALKAVQESGRLDPLHPRHHVLMAQALLAAKRYEEAAVSARESLELAPSRVLARNVLVASLILLGRPQQAVDECRQLPAGNILRLWAEAVLFDQFGDQKRSDVTMSDLKSRYGDLALYQLASVHAQRGEKDQAIASLEAAFQLRDPDLAGLAGDRFFDPLRGDPRFGALISSLNIPA